MSTIHYISHPATSLRGEIIVPGDKSISHRAIILGSISQGITQIDGLLEGEDCRATLQAFRSMGVVVEKQKKNHIVIHGVGKRGLIKPPGVIDCGNSGTTMRLLSGLLAAQSFDSRLTGDESLLKRPMRRVSDPLNQMGADIQTNNGRAPIDIYGEHRLHGIYYEMPNASAQVKTALLLAGMYAKGKTTIVEPDLCRDHTERMFTEFSYPIHRFQKTITIDSKHEGIGTSIQIPSDVSSAAFFIVAATLVPGSKIKIYNVGINPTRIGFIEILNRMGAMIHLENQRLFGQEPVADITVQSALLHGIEIPIDLVASAIDEFPILFIAAACATGKTILRGAEELRLKESDRIQVMAEGLNHLGIQADPQPDGIIIQGGKLQAGEVETHHDHRIAMAFSIAGAVSCAAVKINHCNNVATSFPDFVDVANQVHLLIRSRSQ